MLDQIIKSWSSKWINGKYHWKWCCMKLMMRTIIKVSENIKLIITSTRSHLSPLKMMWHWSKHGGGGGRQSKFPLISLQACRIRLWLYTYRHFIFIFSSISFPFPESPYSLSPFHGSSSPSLPPANQPLSLPLSAVSPFFTPAAAPKENFGQIAQFQMLGQMYLYKVVLQRL